MVWTDPRSRGTSPSKPTMAKVGADLLALHAEYQAQLQQTSGQGAAASAFQSSNTIAPIAGGSVVIDTAASGRGRDPVVKFPAPPATTKVATVQIE